VTKPSFLAVPGPCDLRCLWCNVAGTAPVDLGRAVDELTEELSARRAKGERAIGFGFHHSEPLTFEHFLVLVRRARALGFEKIALSTSGLRLVEPDVVRDLADAGLTEVIISLVTLDEERSDLFLGRSGATAAKVAALSRCLERGLTVKAILMLLRPCLHEVPAAAGALDERGRSFPRGAFTVHGCLMTPVPHNTAEQRALLWPSLAEVAWVEARAREVMPEFEVQHDGSGRPWAAYEPLEPSVETLEDLRRVVGGLDGLSPRPASDIALEPWQERVIALLGRLARRRRPIGGFEIRGASRSPGELRVFLGRGDQDLQVIIEPRAKASRWFFEGEELAISFFNSDLTQDEPEKERVLRMLLTLIERAPPPPTTP
jgi:hypothetical protein